MNITHLAAAIAITAIIPIHGHGGHQAPPRPPIHLTGGQHACTATTTEYLIADGGMHITAHPGSTRITAAYAGTGRWQSAYEVTGAHDELAGMCDGREIPGSRGRYGQALTLGIKVSRHIRITASLHAHGAGRLGWDIWFVADRAEVTPTEMERDPRTFEVMVMQGPGRVFRDNPGWHRCYYAILPGHRGSLRVHGVSLTAIARRLGIPGRLYWQAIDAGGETLHGTFTVDSQAVRIAGQHPQALPHFHVSGHPIVTPEPAP